MSDRYGWNAFALAGAALLFARGGSAQSAGPPITPPRHDHGQQHRARDAAPPPPPSSNQPGPPLTAAEYGEQHARAGDCAGALDAFDRGLRTDYSPELRRDRGACHEKLGHPFPAIDDYRAYLTARPGAADADAIRARLEALESSVGILKSDGDGKNRKSGGADLEISVATAGESDALTAGGSSAGGHSLDKVEHDEQLDQQADVSPVRRGTGFMLALGVDPEAYGKSAVGFAVVAGIDLRYSVSRVSSLLLELNFEHANATGTDTALGGPGVRAGYEARLALDPYVNNALLIGATLAYEHLAQSSTGLVLSDVEPRGRFGYRHVFGPSLGLEATLDGGLALLHLTGASSSSDLTTAVIGGHVAFVLGF